MSDRNTSPPRSILSVKQRACGSPVWRLDTGVVGVGQASWCPDRARSRFGGGVADYLVGEGDLDAHLARARRLKSPEWIVFSPFEDPFTAAVSQHRRDELLRMMRKLLRLGIGVSLTTRGDLTTASGLVELAREYPDAFTVRVGVFTIEARVEEKWERGLSPAVRRLGLARALREVGANVEVELGPIVPFANDDVRQLRDTMRAVARSGLEVVVPRWIEDAPGLERQIELEVSPSTARLVTGWFRAPGSHMGGAHRRILPLQVRRSRLELLEDSARELGLRLRDCACASAGACSACLEGRRFALTPQLELFGRQA
jgi:hypothetical protein